MATVRGLRWCSWPDRLRPDDELGRRTGRAARAVHRALSRRAARPTSGRASSANTCRACSASRSSWRTSPARSGEHRLRSRRQERSGRLHGADRARPGDERAARLQGELRSVEGFGAGHPAVAPARRASGASLARRELARRIDCAGERAPGHELCDLGRRLAAADRRRVVRARSPTSSSSTCPIAAAARRSTTSSPATSRSPRSARRRSSRITRPAPAAAGADRRRSARRACRTCRPIRKRASRGWCSTSGSASSCRPARRRPSSPASTPRSTRRWPSRRSATASCNRRRSRSAAAPSSSRGSCATISRKYERLVKELNIKAN